MKSIWDKTEQEQQQEIAKGHVSEIHKQTVFLLEILKQVGEAIQENKTVKVENIVRQVVGRVSVDRPEWIKELKQDTRPIEKKLDYIASAIIRKEIVRKMEISRPDWIKELIPKDFTFPDSKDFSKPTVEMLKLILNAINDKEVVKEVEIKGPIEIKEPKWLKFPDFEKPILALAKFIKGYFDKTVLKTEIQNDIKITNKEFDVSVKNHQKEIAIKNIKELTDRLDLLAAQLRSMGTTGSNAAAGGGSSSIDMTTVEALLDDIKTNTANINLNVDSVEINTDDIEEKLDTIAGNQLPDGHAVEVNNLPSTYPLPTSQIETLTPPAAITGFATSAKQDTLLTELEKKTEPTDVQMTEMVVILRSMLNVLANPAWVDKSANSLRASITATIATLTTLTTLSNIDGYQGKLQIINQNNAAWAVMVRSRIT